MKYITSVSFGKDSLAMLLLILEKGLPLDEVIFYDTGMEFKAIYNIRDKIKKILIEKNIKFTELHPKEPFLYQMFDKPVVSRKAKETHNGYSWCGGRCRWGTTEKLKAIEKYCEGNHQYVGIAYDEEKRHQRLTINKSSPIYDAKMTEEDCLKYCYDKGFNWNQNGIELYSILDRVSCWCCCNKNLKELKNYYKYLPEYWNKLKELQDKTERPMKYNKYTVYDLEQKFKIEGSDD